jgi:hypothetical protein
MTMHITEALAIKYAEFTGSSVKVCREVWKHSGSNDCDVEWELATVSDGLHCVRNTFKTLTELNRFILDKMELRKQNEILFRKF